MTRLIDADALKESLRLDLLIKGELNYDEVIDLIANAPTVQRDGWVSVPIEPTEEMIKSYRKYIDESPYVEPYETSIKGMYKAMIQAAPTDKE